MADMSVAAPSPQGEFTDPSANTEARCRVVVLERPADLDAYLGAWTALAEKALEPNVFYEPWFLRPTLRAFAQPGVDLAASLAAGVAAPSELCLVLVLGEPVGPPRRSPANELWGLFPLQRRAAGQGAPPVPVSHFRLFQHDYSYVPIPLVHRDHAKMVLAAFFDWMKTQRRCPPLLAIDDFPVGGPFHQLLVDEVARRDEAHVFVRDRWSRALLRPSCDAETYETRAVAGKHRKELRRLLRRLGEMGKVEFTSLSPPGRGAKEDQAELEAWMDEFVNLEASGWKGREGTALGSRIPDATFFREMARGCHAAGRLSATALRLDGRALVMQILLRSGQGAFAFKIGYDESFARYSPGVLLELDLIARVANHRFAEWVDSAAARDHSMINRLWTERRSIEQWLVGMDSGTGWMLASAPLLRWARERLQKRSERKKLRRAAP
jgi:hypothetical protein